MDDGSSLLSARSGHWTDQSPDNASEVRRHDAAGVQGFNLMIGYYKVPLEDQSIDEEGWLHTGKIRYRSLLDAT